MSKIVFPICLKCIHSIYLDFYFYVFVLNVLAKWFKEYYFDKKFILFGILNESFFNILIFICSSFVQRRTIMKLSWPSSQKNYFISIKRKKRST